MEENTRIYFAYGSNLNLMDMKERCPEAKRIGSTFLEGYCLAFKGNARGKAYLIIEKREGAYVPIGIFSIAEEDEKRLDIYEGYPTLYKKERITLPMKETNASSNTITGLIYIMHPYYGYNIPSLYYFETCLKGYKEFHFDSELLNQALKDSEKAKKKQLKRF